MIMIKIEMWPGGDSVRKRDLAAIAIANVGGDIEIGDYDYSVSHQIDSSYGKSWSGHIQFREFGRNDESGDLEVWSNHRIQAALRSRQIAAAGAPWV